MKSSRKSSAQSTLGPRAPTHCRLGPAERLACFRLVQRAGVTHSCNGPEWPKGQTQPRPALLPAQTLAPLHSPQGLDKVEVGELVQAHERMKHLDVKVVSVKKSKARGGGGACQALRIQARPSSRRAVSHAKSRGLGTPPGRRPVCPHSGCCPQGRAAGVGAAASDKLS